MKYINWETIQRLFAGIALLKANCNRGFGIMKKRLFPKEALIEQLYLVIEKLQAENQHLAEENERLSDEAAMAFAMLDEMKAAESQVGDLVKALTDVFTPTQEELLSSIIITDDVGEA